MIACFIAAYLKCQPFLLLNLFFFDAVGRRVHKERANVFIILGALHNSQSTILDSLKNLVTPKESPDVI